MTQEQPSTRHLYNLLKEAKKDNEYIIEVFVSIIQQKQMYGGDISDSVNYWIQKIKKEILLQ